MTKKSKRAQRNTTFQDTFVQPRSPSHRSEEEQQELEAVLEAYCLYDSGPSKDTLAVWADRYPAFAEELRTFTAQWALVQYLPDVPLATDDTADSLILRTMSAVRTMLFQQRSRQTPLISVHDEHAQQTSANGQRRLNAATTSTSAQFIDTPIQGLLSAGKELCLNPQALADKIGIQSVSLLVTFDRRLVTPDSIPSLLYQNMATALQRRTTAAVATYMHKPPRFSHHAVHHSNDAPRLPDAQLSFREVVLADAELSDDMKAVLLALIVPS